MMQAVDSQEVSADGEVVSAPTFTPGPWRVAKPPSKADPRLLIVAAYSAKEAAEHPLGVTEGLNGKWIAEVRPYKRSQLEPDARLIAAAPDLYGALLAAHQQLLNTVNWIVDEQLRAQVDSAIDVAEAALAKAEDGVQP